MWPVVDRLDNEFGNFTVEETIYDGRQARVLFCGPLHSAQSGIALDDNPRMLFDYNQLLYETALTLNPKSMLILGGGTMTLPSALAKALPKTRIKVVEINKGLILLAKKHFNFKPSRKLKVIIDDGYKYLMKQTDKYDLIIIDVYNEFTIPEQFLRLKFSSLLKSALNPNGLVAANCISSISGEASLNLRRIAYNYSSEIGEVRIIKIDKRYNDSIPQNLLVFCTINNDLLKRLLNGAEEIEASRFVNNY